MAIGDANYWRREFVFYSQKHDDERQAVLRVLQPAADEGRNFKPDATDDEAHAIEALASRVLDLLGAPPSVEQEAKDAKK